MPGITIILRGESQRDSKQIHVELAEKYGLKEIAQYPYMKKEGELPSVLTATYSIECKLTLKKLARAIREKTLQYDLQCQCYP
jgi:hypothetical protein